MNRTLKLSGMALAALAAFLLATRGCARCSSYWYEGYLPEAIEVEGSVFVEDSGGVREACGAAIYKIDASSLQRIRTEGLDAIRTARQAKRHQAREYGDWKETPYVEPQAEIVRNGWLTGMNEGCSDIPSHIQRDIAEAMREPGSFYATGHESGLLLIPKRGWIIFSHFG
ncbi:hypothetical protein DJFAAGMI_01123 [Comamonas sp. PE63]|uniref:Lipoprotein n=1 Tax=Comamonas brasiliensis TaxID=1812482 RepID=A0ABS5LPG9_9BURK|nr:hypothetical protein [Comamonas sp. PE63]MBS3018391.1 hypothetical protein [Comamonas sp. PE63]